MPTTTRCVCIYVLVCVSDYVCEWACVMIDLVDALRPRVIKYNYVKDAHDEVCMCVSECVCVFMCMCL